MPLSLRLQTLLDRCHSDLPLWDLCCDHGLLGLQALNSGRFTEVIFNDIVPHVLEPLRRQVGDDARVICAPAEDIPEQLTGNLVLAGIGGERILKILLAHFGRGTLRAKHIVTCPEKDAEWLARQNLPGYSLCEDTTIPHSRGERRILVFKALPTADPDALG